MTKGPRCYLDHNATSPLRPAAREAMLAVMQHPANPSSVHAEGRRARGIMEKARAQVAALFEADPDGVIFTSCATEAANQALTAEWSRKGVSQPVGRAYASAVEHACILAGGRLGRDRVASARVDSRGRLDLRAFEAALAAHDAASGRPLGVVQLANNETGVIQPSANAAEILRRHDGFMLCDAVQAAGRVPIEIDKLGVDALLVSGHKMGGPAGVGALVLTNPEVRPSALLCGGGQERGARGGTENVAAIAGFGAAAEDAAAQIDQEQGRLARLSTRLEAELRRIAPDCVIFGAGEERLPNTSCFAVPGAKAEMLLIALDLAGVAVSSGSACTAGKVGRSHVLAAMGVAPALAAGALRVSLGWNSMDDDVTRFAGAFEKVLATLHESRERRAA